MSVYQNAIKELPPIKRLAVAGARLAVAALVLGGSVSTASATPAGDFYACLKKDGKVSQMSVDTAPICRNNETLVQWNQMGPQGEQGSPGSAGAQGAAGVSPAYYGEGRGLFGGSAVDVASVPVPAGNYAITVSGLFVRVNSAPTDQNIEVSCWVPESSVTIPDPPNPDITIYTVSGQATTLVPGAVYGGINFIGTLNMAQDGNLTLTCRGTLDGGTPLGANTLQAGPFSLLALKVTSVN